MPLYRVKGAFEPTGQPVERLIRAADEGEARHLAITDYLMRVMSIECVDETVRGHEPRPIDADWEPSVAVGLLWFVIAMVVFGAVCAAFLALFQGQIVTVLLTLVAGIGGVALPLTSIAIIRLLQRIADQTRRRPTAPPPPSAPAAPPPPAVSPPAP